MGTYTWRKCPVPEDLPVRQVYGIAFSNDGRILLRIEDGKLIGCIKIHNSLTDELKNGGHIAYGIRPSERGKGYGKMQLQLGLAYAKHLRLDHVTIACDRDNPASASTAISCGGVLVKEFEEDGIIKQHYHIDL